MKTHFGTVLWSILVAWILSGSWLVAQSFTVIGIPDTQNYSELFPSIFYGQTQWVANQREALDIRFVSHYGDLVQNGDQLVEWAVADQAMATLDQDDIPYGTSAGNHDITPTGTFGEPYIPQFYQSYFGPQRFAGRSWYRGTSPSGMSSWQVFNGGGLEFLALHIECDGALDELVWAQGVLDANRDKPVMLTTHRYLQDAEDYTAGVPVVPSGRYPSIWYAIETPYTPNGLESNEIFDWFVRRNPNVFLVNCGHFHEEYRQTSTNVAGHPVHEVLADYQDDPNGGNGWLRIMTFDLGQNQIDFDSYSTHLDQFRSADESDFSLPVVWSDYRSSEPTVVLQDGINGYQGTRDTWIDEDSPNQSFGQSGVRVADDDTTNSFFSDEQGQALVRFEGLFGGTGRVPLGSQILEATLTLQISDDIDSPIFDPDFFVHRVLVPWDESSTWNSMAGGLGGSDLSPVVAVFDGDNSPDGDGLRRIDVTAAVQAWSNGAPNHGFAILPEIIGGNDDGIEILTSESGNPLLRPRLEVTYASSCGYQAFGGTPTAAHTMSLSGLGLPHLGGWADLQTTNVPSTLVFHGASAAAANLANFGGVVLIDDQQLILPLTPIFGAAGESLWSVPIPNNPALIGGSVFLQTYAPDGTLPGGIAFSNGLELIICP